MDRKNGCTNKTIPRMYAAWYKQDMKVQEGAKRAKFWAKQRTKIQNRQF